MNVMSSVIRRYPHLKCDMCDIHVNSLYVNSEEVWRVRSYIS